MKTSKILAAVATAAVAASCVAVSASAYTGYIGFQTTPYSFRNAWDDASYGKDSAYFDKFIVWGGNSDETWPDLAEEHYDYDLSGGGGYVFDAEYTDTEINADGTYTVSVSGIDWALDGADNFNLIFVSTDIPNDGTVTIKEASVIVDGVKTYTTDTFVVSENDQYLKVELANIWNTELPTYTGGYPTESLAVEFTLEGLGAPAGDTAVDTDAPAAGDNKGNADTGVEGVAVVAGLAVVAGGALVISKKRK